MCGRPYVGDSGGAHDDGQPTVFYMIILASTSTMLSQLSSESRNALKITQRLDVMSLW